MRGVWARPPVDRDMIDVVVLGFILAATAAAGVLVLRLADALPRDRDEHVLAGLATGLGLASMLALGLAAAGILRPLLLIAAGAAALAAGGPDLLAALRALRGPRSRTARALVAVCAVVLLAEAPTWFAPPVHGIRPSTTSCTRGS